MELTNLISSSATVDIYQEGNMAIKVFKEGCPKTMALYEALTHSPRRGYRPAGAGHP